VKKGAARLLMEGRHLLDRFVFLDCGRPGLRLRRQYAAARSRAAGAHPAHEAATRDWGFDLRMSGLLGTHQTPSFLHELNPFVGWIPRRETGAASRCGLSPLAFKTLGLLSSPY
jgi:hypothetical protein